MSDGQRNEQQIRHHLTDSSAGDVGTTIIWNLLLSWTRDGVSLVLHLLYPTESAAPFAVWTEPKKNMTLLDPYTHCSFNLKVSLYSRLRPRSLSSCSRQKAIHVHPCDPEWAFCSLSQDVRELWVSLAEYGVSLYKQTDPTLLSTPVSLSALCLPPQFPPVSNVSGGILQVGNGFLTGRARMGKTWIGYQTEPECQTSRFVRNKKKPFYINAPM